MVQVRPIKISHGKRPTVDSFQMDVQSLPQLLEYQSVWKEIEKTEAQQRYKKRRRTCETASKAKKPNSKRPPRKVGDTVYVHLESVQFVKGEGWCAAWHQAVVTKVYRHKRKRMMDVRFENFPDEFDEDKMYKLPQHDPDCISSTFPYENKYWFEVE